MATSAAGAVDKNKDAPDLAKLGSMSSRVVQVTKRLSRSGAGQLVVPAWKSVSVDQITSLQTELPAKHGPGTYHFEVYDEGGPDKVEWTVRLGPETEAPPAVEPANGYGPSNGSSLYTNPTLSGVSPARASQGSIEIGGGYRYNEELGLLVTPDKQIHQWRPGEDLPGRLPRQQQPTNWMGMMNGAPATPYNPQGFPGWGNIPIDKSDDDKVKALEEQLREERRAREEAERRRETQEMIARLEKQREEDAKRFEQLLSKLSEKPSGPSPEMLALQEQNKRLEQQTEQARRDAELARRDQEHKAEMQTLREMIAKASENKQDPMMPMMTMLGQIMTNGQTSQAEVVKAMRDSAQAQAQAAERNSMTLADRLSGSIMTPVQIVELMKRSDEGSGAINKSMVEMFQNLFGMAQGLVREQAQLYSQGEGPAWLPVAQEGVAQLGRVASMFAQAKAQGDNAALQAERRARAEAMRRAAAATPPVQQLAAVAPQDKTPAERVREAAAKQVFPGVQPGTPQAHRDELADQVFGARDPNTGAPSGRPPRAQVPVDPDMAQAMAELEAESRRQAAAQQQGVADAGAESPTEDGAPKPRKRKPRKAASSRKRKGAQQQAEQPEQQPEQAPEQQAEAPAGQPAEAPSRGAVQMPDGSVVPASTARQVPVPAPTVPPAAQSVAQPDTVMQPGDAAPDDGDDEDADLTEEEIHAVNAQASEASPDALRQVTDQMSDEEFFGPALPDVQELRDKLAATPDEITPTDIAKFILTARQQLLSFGIFPPAAEMLDLGHVEILVQRLLPGVPPQAHEIVVQHTRVLMQQASVGAPQPQG